MKITNCRTSLLLATVVVLAMFTGKTNAQVAVTEVNSNSDASEDWFELTNVGSAAVDITGWGFDDYPEDVEKIATIEGVTSIGAGESVVVLQFDDESEIPLVDQIQGFRDAWSGLTGVQIGYHTGSGLGKDDGVSIFGADSTLLAQTIYFDPTADPEADLHAGESVGATKIDSAIWDPTSGTDSPILIAPVLGSYGVFAASDGGLGSPGVVDAIPEPSGISLALASLLGLGLLRRKK